MVMTRKPHIRRPGVALVATLLGVAVLAGPPAAGAAPPAERAAPVNTAPPAISGQARVGTTLSATQGEWQGSPTAFFYQWLRCNAGDGVCEPIGGATAPTYELTGAELGFRIRVEVVAQNGDGSSLAQRSAATGIVKIQPPVSTAKPTISGIAREGETLSATTGTWSGAPTSFTYVWKRCLNGTCPTIPGAAGSTYQLVGADVGSRVRVRVVAGNAGGNTAAHSATTAVVQSSTAGLELGPPKHDQRRGLVRFRVAVPSAGLLVLKRTAKVKGDSRTAAGAGTLKLTVKPRGQAKRRLNRRGKARVPIKVSFTPTVGVAVELRRNVTLRG